MAFRPSEPPQRRTFALGACGAALPATFVVVGCRAAGAQVVSLDTATRVDGPGGKSDETIERRARFHTQAGQTNRLQIYYPAR